MVGQKYVRTFSTLLLASLGLVGGCDVGGVSPARDGLYLEYQVGESSSCALSFEDAGGGKFRVVAEPERCSLWPGAPSDGEVLVDHNLRPAGGGKLEWGEAVLLWLPKNKRKPGSYRSVAGGGGFSVSRVERWHDWDTAVIQAKIALLKGVWYYDVKTGFLVGMEKEFAYETNLIYLLVGSNLDE